MERAKLKSDDSSVGNYFVKQKGVEFYTSGAAVIDCCLGGGYPIGKVTNIVGDKSTGKTLMAIEACANFLHKYPDGKIFYCEVEAAFDEAYAQALGIDTNRIKFVPDIDTVEDFFSDIQKRLSKLDGSTPSLYILDSLDALSDKAEMIADVDKGTYGTTKAKMMSRMFRQTVKRIDKVNMHLIIISQIRDNINAAMFGRKTTRSGGKALDFYASQVIYLAPLGQIKKTKKGVARPIGVKIRLKVDKNKVGLPYRECQYPIIFGYGIDDVTANIEWLKENKRLQGVYTEKEAKEIMSSVLKMSGPEIAAIRKKTNKAVRRSWTEIETSFIPPRGKYA